PATKTIFDPGESGVSPRLQSQMMEIFDSVLRARGDLAGVFEFDGETGYFYLYATNGSEGQKVADSIHIVAGNPAFDASDVSFRWDLKDEKVGLFIRNTLWAVFDCRRRTKFGGGNMPGGQPSVPVDSASGF